MTGKTRHVSHKIKELLKYFPIVAIVGARQVGKTTLAKTITKNWHYFDLENPNDANRITHDPIFFFKQYPNNVIIDEAQEYPELFKVLRGVIDQDRELKGRFIITGSSSPQLLSAISESLAGRIATIELGTLKSSEIYNKDLSSFYNIFSNKLTKNNLNILSDKPNLSSDNIAYSWYHGGYPEPTLSKNNLFFAQWMEQYRDTYINRDIAKLFPKLNKNNYQKFLFILSHLSGTILNKSNISRALEISEKTVREYIKIITDTFIWRSIPSYEKNIVKSIIKMPKGYIRDTGLLHYLLEINKFDDLFKNPIVGGSFEGFVIEEITKGLQATMTTNWKTSYYRTRNGAEIDLIISGPFGILPIEIKYGMYTSIKQLKTLDSFVREHDLPFALLINQADDKCWLTDRVFQLPVRWI